MEYLTEEEKRRFVPFSVAEETDPNDSFLGDVGTFLKLGSTVDVARTATGLADVVGSAFGAETSLTQAANDAGLSDYENRALRDLTPETRAQMEAVERVKQESEAAGDSEFVQGLKTTGAYIANPRAAAGMVTRSLPTMLIGGGGGSLAAKGAVAYGTKKLAKDMVAKAGERAAKKSLSQSAYGAGMQAAAREGRILHKQLPMVSDDMYRARIAAARKAGSEASPSVKALNKARDAELAARRQAATTGWDDTLARAQAIAARKKFGERAAAIGASAGEGVMSTGMTAAAITDYNAAHPEERTALQGVGWAVPSGMITGAVAYGAGQMGGNVEAAMFNKGLANQTTGGWKGLAKSVATESAEEMAQAPGEQIPQNIATDQPWHKGLGSNMAESALAGGLMGAGMHGAARTRSWASPNAERPHMPQGPANVGEAAKGVPAIGSQNTPQASAIDQIIQAAREQQAKEKQEKEAATAAQKQQREQAAQQAAAAKEAEAQRKAAEKAKIEQDAREREQAVANFINRFEVNDKQGTAAGTKYHTRSKGNPLYAPVAELIHDTSREVYADDESGPKMGWGYKQTLEAVDSLYDGKVTDPATAANKLDQKADELLRQSLTKDIKGKSDEKSFEGAYDAKVLALTATRLRNPQATLEEFDKVWRDRVDGAKKDLGFKMNRVTADIKAKHDFVKEQKKRNQLEIKEAAKKKTEKELLEKDARRYKPINPEENDAAPTANEPPAETAPKPDKPPVSAAPKSGDSSTSSEPPANGSGGGTSKPTETTEQTAKESGPSPVASEPRTEEAPAKPKGKRSGKKAKQQTPKKAEPTSVDKQEPTGDATPKVTKEDTETSKQSAYTDEELDAMPPEDLASIEREDFLTLTPEQQRKIRHRLEISEETGQIPTTEAAIKTTSVGRKDDVGYNAGEGNDIEVVDARNAEGETPESLRQINNNNGMYVTGTPGGATESSAGKDGDSYVVKLRKSIVSKLETAGVVDSGLFYIPSEVYSKEFVTSLVDAFVVLQNPKSTKDARTDALAVVGKVKTTLGNEAYVDEMYDEACRRAKLGIQEAAAEVVEEYLDRYKRSPTTVQGALAELWEDNPDALKEAMDAVAADMGDNGSKLRLPGYKWFDKDLKKDNHPTKSMVDKDLADIQQASLEFISMYEKILPQDPSFEAGGAVLTTLFSRAEELGRLSQGLSVRNSGSKSRQQKPEHSRGGDLVGKETEETEENPSSHSDGKLIAELVLAGKLTPIEAIRKLSSSWLLKTSTAPKLEADEDAQTVVSKPTKVTERIIKALDLGNIAKRLWRGKLPLTKAEQAKFIDQYFDKGNTRALQELKGKLDPMFYTVLRKVIDGKTDAGARARVEWFFNGVNNQGGLLGSEQQYLNNLLLPKLGEQHGESTTLAKAIAQNIGLEIADQLLRNGLITAGWYGANEQKTRNWVIQAYSANAHIRKALLDAGLPPNVVEMAMQRSIEHYADAMQHYRQFEGHDTLPENIVWENRDATAEVPSWGRNSKSARFLRYSDLKNIKAKANTAVAAEIQESVRLVEEPSGANGIAVPLDVLLKHKGNLRNNLEGLFSESFIHMVDHVVDAFEREGLTIPTNILLIDSTRSTKQPYFSKEIGDTPAAGGVCHNMVSASDCTMLTVGKTTEVSPVMRGEFVAVAFSFSDKPLTNAEMKFNLEITACHEMIHALDDLSSIDIRDKLNKKISRDPVLKKEFYDMGTRGSGLVLLETKYPKNRSDSVEERFRERTRLAETIAVVGSLYISSSSTRAELLRYYPNLTKTIMELIHEGDKNAKPQPSVSVLRPTTAGRTKSSREALGRKEGGEGELALAELPRQHGAYDQATEGRHSQGGRKPVLPLLRERGREDGVTPPPSPEARNKVRELVENALGLLPPSVRAFAGNIVDKLYTNGLGVLFTHDLVNAAVNKTGISAFRKWETANKRIDASRNARMSEAADIQTEFDRLPAKQQKEVNDYLRDSTLSECWGYWEPAAFKTEAEWAAWMVKDGEEKEAEHRKMVERFNKLSNSQQAVVRKIFRYGLKTRNERANMILNQIKGEYYDLLSRTKNDERKKALIKQLDVAIKKVTSNAEALKSPYAPLRRFGSHAVVVRSQEMSDTQEALRRLYDITQEQDEPSEDDMRTIKILEDRVNELAAKENDYIVEFVDGKGTARERARELQAQFPNAKVEFFARQEHDPMAVPSWQKLESVVSAIRKDMNDDIFMIKGGKGAQSIMNSLHATAMRMYVDSLSEESARKQEKHRRKVAGFNQDMMANFMETARSNATMLAQMEFGKQVRDAMGDISLSVRDYKGKDRTVAQEFENEVIRRQELAINPTSDVVRQTMRFTSSYMLLGNPAFYLQNMTQPFMMSAPFMAGRHGGGVFGRLVSTTKEVLGWMKNDPTLANIRDHLSEDEWKALDHARRYGDIDVGITQDFGDVNRRGGVVTKAINRLSETARKVEMLNRVATFLTAYRLEKAKTGNSEQARVYADSVVYQTHGDYSGFNAPRYFKANGFLKIATQFRKFQLIQAGMMLRLAKEAFKGASVEERSVGKRALAWTMCTHFLMAGATGTPFLATALGLLGWAFGETGDDDEDWLRKLIGSKTEGDLIVRGLPAMLGLDLSDKVGAKTMFTPMPFYEPKSGRAGAAELALNAIGPAGNLAVKVFEASKWLSQGDYWKAIEQMMPNGVFANGSKALRYSWQGNTTKAGDVTIKPEEFSTTDLILQAMGLPTDIITTKNRLQGSLIRHEDAFESKKAEIYMDYKKARKSGDMAGMREARRELAELSKERVAQGFKPYKAKDMVQAATSQRKREREVVSGVGTKSTNRRFMELASQR